MSFFRHESLSIQQNNWRKKVFLSTWLAYASFYLCRKNFSVVMPILSEDFSYTKEDLAFAITIYSLFYMIGQFLNGYLSDKHGPRIIVTTGLLISIVANIFMGFTASLAVITFMMGLNGLGQSAGWSGLLKNLTPWFRKIERGVIMSWWSTCYVVGSFLATILATYFATTDLFWSDYGWRRAFWIPAAMLLVSTVVYIRYSRNKPTDVGLDMIVPDKENNYEQGRTSKHDIFKMVLTNRTAWIAAIIYFFIKLIRYSFLFWLPLYITEALQYETDQAGYLSSSYELFGFLGVLIAGYVSDRIYNARRFPITAIMMFGLAAVCFLQPIISSLGVMANIFSIGLIGVMTYGPDSIISGATAMDLGGKRGAASSAGFINGVGSMGQLVSPALVAYVAGTHGWDSLFQLFIVLAICGGLLALMRWNYGGRKTAPYKIE